MGIYDVNILFWCSFHTRYPKPKKKTSGESCGKRKCLEQFRDDEIERFFVVVDDGSVHLCHKLFVLMMHPISDPWKCFAKYALN